MACVRYECRRSPISAHVSNHNQPRVPRRAFEHSRNEYDSFVCVQCAVTNEILAVLCEVAKKQCWNGLPLIIDLAFERCTWDDVDRELSVAYTVKTSGTIKYLQAVQAVRSRALALRSVWRRDGGASSRETRVAEERPYRTALR